MGSSTPCVQDHVILLVSTPDFENPPAWLKENFNIIEGGTHGDQRSRNKLVIFEDGTYLELFNWINKPETSAWADRLPGLIDFALTSLPPSTADSLHQEIDARLKQPDGTKAIDFVYKTPEAGSRLRKDGVEVKWKLSRPVPNSASDKSSSDSRLSASGHRKDLPFFCHDVTARNVRVPFDDVEKTSHPCGATGISGIVVGFPKAQHQEHVNNYENLLGVPGHASSDGESYDFEVGLPISGSPASKILVVAEQDQEQISEPGKRKDFIRGLRLRVKGREGHGLQALGSEEIASTLFLEW